MREQQVSFASRRSSLPSHFARMIPASPEDAASRTLARIPASRTGAGWTPFGSFHPVLSPDGAWLGLASILWSRPRG
jgi:hypothetical protein